MRIARVDSNQKEIVLALRRHGALVKHTHTIKNLFDILVYFQGNTYSVEIKDGNKPPSQRKLTDGEKKCKEEMESKGVKYWVVESVEEALKMLEL